jgi:DNA gyrase inhibitor GyrI
MLVHSIDQLAPYKVSDDLVLELVSVTAIIEDDPEGAAAAPCRVDIVEPHTLIVHQPPGRSLLENRHTQMTCAKSAGIRSW